MTDLPQGAASTLYKNSVKYLLNISNQIPNSLNASSNVNVLKSYYMLKSHVFQLLNGFNLQENKNKPKCTRCCLPLSDSRASSIIKPELKRKFARKLLEKKKRQKPLTKYQLRYLKKNTVHEGNQLAITCNFCKKELLINLQKPKKLRRNVKKLVPKFNKKKKKKDKFCGLQAGAVVAAQTQKSGSLNRTLNNKILQRKAVEEQKRNMVKLSKMLNDKSKLRSQNKLENFLEIYKK